jgi:hypothetical protein
VSKTDVVVKELLFDSNIPEEVLNAKEFWQCSESLKPDNDYSKILRDYVHKLDPESRATSTSHVKPLPIALLLIYVSQLTTSYKIFSNVNIIEILSQLSVSANIDDIKLESKKSDWIRKWYNENFDIIIKRILKFTFVEHHKKYKDAAPNVLYGFSKLHDICLINDASKFNQLVLDAEVVNLVLSFVAKNKELIQSIDDIFLLDARLPLVYVSSRDQLSPSEYNMESISNDFEDILHRLRTTVDDDDKRSDILNKMKDALKKENVTRRNFTLDEDQALMMKFKEDSSRYAEQFNSSTTGCYRDEDSIKACSTVR